MPSLRVPSLPLIVLLVAGSACNGGSDGGSDGTAGSTGSGTTGSGSGSASTSSGSGSAGSSGGTSSGTTASGSSGGGSGGSSGGGSSGSGSSGGGSSGGGVDCTALAMAPVTPELVYDGFSGSEDLDFDGAGNIVAKNGNQLDSVDAMGQAVKLADLAGQAYGMRQRPGGTFVVALPQADKVVEVDGSNVMDLWTDLQTPNGLWVDEMDRIWVTEFGGNGVSLRLPNGDTSNVIPAQDAPSANGVLFDPVRSMLFFTNYSGGELRRAPIDAMGNAGTVEIVDSVNGALDGLALDACGNVYAVDQQAAEIVRFLLQPDGSSAAVPEVLASAPTNIANAVFGRGPGFDPESLYAAGNPGDVYRIPTGVPGR